MGNELSKVLASLGESGALHFGFGDFELNANRSFFLFLGEFGEGLLVRLDGGGPIFIGSSGAGVREESLGVIEFDQFLSGTEMVGREAEGDEEPKSGKNNTHEF